MPNVRRAQQFGARSPWPGMASVESDDTGDRPRSPESGLPDNGRVARLTGLRNVCYR